MNYLLLTQYQGKIVGPIAWLLGHIINWIFMFLNKIGLPSTGVAIILFTIIINLLLLPLTYKQQKFSKLQAKMNPELQAIQAKYKGKKDNESVYAQQEEIKALYAKYGVSQTGTCLQLLIQFPIMYALLRIINSIPAYVPQIKQAFYPLVSELREAGSKATEVIQSLSTATQFNRQFLSEKFLAGDVQTIENTFIDVLNSASGADWDTLKAGFSSLSDSIASTQSLLGRYNYFLGLNIAESPRYILVTAFNNRNIALLIGALIVPLLAGLTQWVSLKLMPQATPTSNDPNDQTAQMANSMKTMSMTMPLFSIFLCFTVPVGVGIYWSVGPIIRTIEQIFINKHIDKMDIEAEIVKNTEKYQKKLDAKKSTPQMNQYANMNTRNLKRNFSSNLSESDKNAAIKKASDIYDSGKASKTSLLARANMVKEFDNKNNKQGDE